MKTVKIIDSHPGKWHEGLEVTLVHVIAPKCTGTFEPFLSGVIFDYSGKPRGMFSSVQQPLQCIVEENGKYIFTTCACGSISGAELEQLKIRGEIEIGNPGYPIRIRLLS